MNTSTIKKKNILQKKINTRRTVTSFWQVNKQILYYMCIKINNEIQQIILVSWCFNILIFSNFIFIFLMSQYTNF